MRQILALLAFATLAHSQMPHLAEINFYGLHKVSAEKILSATHLSPGGSLPASKGDLEDAIERVPDVVQARVEAVCCEGNTAALFIGIEERGAAHAAFRSEPAGGPSLPQPLVETYRHFLSAVTRAAAHGNTSEDLTSGHSVMDDPDARALQPQFGTFAAGHLPQLHEVLRNCSEPDQRAVAAAVIGYAPPSQELVNELEYALDDPEAAVRANAIRSLKAVAVFASKQQQPGLKISPTWFVELLHSVELSDRMESTKALLLLTDHGGQSAIGLIHERALPDLAEMARWKTLRYALPSFLLLGRVAGLSDAATQQAWEKGDREAAIQKALGFEDTKSTKHVGKL
jgi:HEAT repeats